MIDARGGMIKQLAKDYYNNLYTMPLSSVELEEFAKLVLEKFIQDLEDNKQTVAWNYGCDSVIFHNRDLENKSLMTIKEEYIGNKDNQSNTNDTDGRRVERSTTKDKSDI